MVSAAVVSQIGLEITTFFLFAFKSGIFFFCCWSYQLVACFTCVCVCVCVHYHWTFNAIMVVVVVAISVFLSLYFSSNWQFFFTWLYFLRHFWRFDDDNNQIDVYMFVLSIQWFFWIFISFWYRLDAHTQTLVTSPKTFY